MRRILIFPTSLGDDRPAQGPSSAEVLVERVREVEFHSEKGERPVFFLSFFRAIPPSYPKRRVLELF